MLYSPPLLSLATHRDCPIASMEHRRQASTLTIALRLRSLFGQCSRTMPPTARRGLRAEMKLCRYRSFFDFCIGRIFCLAQCLLQILALDARVLGASPRVSDGGAN